MESWNVNIATLEQVEKIIDKAPMRGKLFMLRNRASSFVISEENVWWTLPIISTVDLMVMGRVIDDKIHFICAEYRKYTPGVRYDIFLKDSSEKIKVWVDEVIAHIDSRYRGWLKGSQI